MIFRGSKGSWNFGSNDSFIHNDFILTDNNLNKIGTINNNNDSESIFNIKVISRAPELLEMLKMILELSEGNLKLETDITLEEYYTEFNEARELIKQITTL